ncbi:MAG TPA: sigma 54-interacting transcriptional regulator [Polyangia bacterium]|nr:sigma 54-interacting transcriptional regulator [Polyangia bacterium]
MRRTVEALLAAARTDAPIVLRGELGTEVLDLARLAHQQSARRERRFETLACASLDQLPARTLAAMAGGTIFLHEVGELAAPLQPKLVHLLDALASRGPPPRLISSNRRDLDEEVAGGRLGSELCFRLNVVDIQVPPLRERPEDVLPAARGIILSLSTDLGRRAPALSTEAAAMLQRYPFPGNVRELRNLVERALLVCPGDLLETDAFANLKVMNRPSGVRVGEDVKLRDLESEHVARVIERVRNLRKAATILGIDASTLWRIRKRLEHATSGSDKSR